MTRWWNRLLLLGVIALTAFSVYAVWPGEPTRYLPDFIPWPEGRGVELTVPSIEGGSFGTTTIERREMRLGLDLRGGSRLVLEPAGDQQVEDLEEALEGARDVIERRVNEFGVAESEVNIRGDDRITVHLPGIGLEEAKQKIGRTGLLQFCEPVTNEAGDVAIARAGTVQYQPQTCEPVRDEAGNIVIEGGAIEFAPWDPNVQTFQTSDIIWQPAVAEIDGREFELTGEYLRPTAVVLRHPITNEPELHFEWNSTGSELSGEITERLAARLYPFAPFLDGEPMRGEGGAIIAPSVQSRITGNGVITGLEAGEARDVAKLLNTGAFPLRLVVAQEETVDATLGDTAVRNSVIAGEIALLVIMAFMILYYRLPGVMAALALVVYTSLVLAIFKLWPVTLTLAGVAAFVLSVGMAVDANILIFERMKEELRVGRNLVAALEDGFNRAWSSIRDSNISTLITCAILYWFGDQFDEAAIKGFAITLAVGVVLSMFSAITVTRTFMRVLIGIRPLSRRHWLFVPDLPDDMRHGVRPAPAVAGGSGDEPRGGRRR